MYCIHVRYTTVNPEIEAPPPDSIGTTASDTGLVFETVLWSPDQDLETRVHSSSFCSGLGLDVKISASRSRSRCNGFRILPWHRSVLFFKM